MIKSYSIYPVVLLVILSCFWVAGCSSSTTEPEDAISLLDGDQAVAEPTQLPTSTPLPPAATPVPPTVSPTSELTTTILNATQGSAATIDGTFSPGEWDGAFSTNLTNGGELMIMHNGGHLFLGIRSREMGFGSICTVNDDQVSVLHSSAGLGIAIFKKDGEDWLRTQQFSYCCWGAPEGEMADFLQREGWLASLGTQGVPEEMEYQIDMNGGPLTLAVVYLDDFSFESALHWPEDLDDDCLGLALRADDPPERLVFHTDTWVTIITSSD